jgi:hypothetical protein
VPGMWAILAALLGAFTIWQALPRNRHDKLITAGVWYFFMISCLLVFGWIFAFQVSFSSLNFHAVASIILPILTSRNNEKLESYPWQIVQVINLSHLVPNYGPRILIYGSASHCSSFDLLPHLSRSTWSASSLQSIALLAR